MDAYIYVTDHAVERYRQRKKQVTRENAIHKIIENVRRSRIIAMDAAGKETREHRGLLFVCKMESGILTVITVLFSEVAHRFVS